MSFSNRKVVPSYFNSRPMGETVESDTHNGTMQLLMGEVKEIIDPTDAKSLSKKYLEYTVDVQHRSGSGPASTVRFTNCLLVNPFGGIADKIHYTLRADPDDPTGKDVAKTGAKVLLLCVHGSSNNAFIIGGIREDKGKDEKEFPDKKDQHQLFFEFNGVQLNINNDGELQVRYRGPTAVSGKLKSDEEDADSATSGATIIFTKEGGIKAYTKDEKQFIHLDHENKKIDILADEEWHVKVNKKLAFEMDDVMEVSGKKTCTITMDDKVFIKSAGVHVGAATDAWMLGSTYRQNEGMMNQKLSGYLNAITSLLSTAATSMNAAAAAMKPPIAGAIAASIPLQAAAVALTSAGPLFAQMASAITTFESSASSYLSTKNKND